MEQFFCNKLLKKYIFASFYEQKYKKNNAY